MKKIKQLKQIDFYLQLIAMITGILYSLFNGELAFIAVYFIVGALQVLSFFVHLIAGPHISATPGRRRYGWFLLVTALLLLLGVAIGPLFFFVLVALLFISPVIAIAYCNMCYKELQLINHESK